MSITVCFGYELLLNLNESWHDFKEVGVVVEICVLRGYARDAFVRAIARQRTGPSKC